MDESRQVYVIGGGPAGLAAAAELRRRGMRPVILERGEEVGTSWRAGYDRLHLHTRARSFTASLRQLTACSRVSGASGRYPFRTWGSSGAVRSGKVTPVAAVTGFEGDKVLLADGSAVGAQAVIAATGYRRGLEQLVGHLGVLDENGMPKVRGGPPAAPGLFFLGYTVSLRGMLRDIAADARRVAPAVARDL